MKMASPPRSFSRSPPPASTPFRCAALRPHSVAPVSLGIDVGFRTSRCKREACPLSDPTTRSTTRTATNRSWILSLRMDINQRLPPLPTCSSATKGPFPARERAF